MGESSITIPTQSLELTAKEYRYKLEFWHHGLPGMKQLMLDEGDEELAPLIKIWAKEESDFLHEKFGGKKS